MRLVDLDPPVRVETKQEDGIEFVQCQVLALNSKGKEIIREFMAEALQSLHAEQYLDDLFMSVIELAFNGLKANYAYMAVVEKIRRMVGWKDKQITPHMVLESAWLFRLYDKLIGHQANRQRVKEVMEGEGEVFRLQERVAAEERDFTEEEQLWIEERLAILGKTIQEDIRTVLKIYRTEELLQIDVINDAPIGEEGLKRIEDKRARFYDYYRKDQVALFYMENLDTTESAGFGAAMIDSRLLDWGLEPSEHFTVEAMKHRTRASLRLAAG